MSESSSADLEPQTLPRYYPKERHNQRDTTPTFSSPSASPSLSFPSPSRSFPFSPLRRSPSPPNTNSLHSPQADAGNRDRPHVVRDHKDALTQRLNDLAARLAADEVMQGEDVDSMHTKVDELEALMFMMRSKPLNYDRARSLTSDNYEGPGSGSGRLRSSSLEPHFSKVSLPKSEQTVPQHHGIGQGSCLGHPEHVEGTNKHQVTRVLAEAQKLQAALESIVNNLKARQEEQEHIHDLLITRAERAAQRIIYLEGRVRDLENERNEGEMEILNLQIQLKAIEVQCLSYVPKDADPDLLRSIDAWKSEWSALKRNKTRKKGEDVAAQRLSSPVPRSSRQQFLRHHAAE